MDPYLYLFFHVLSHALLGAVIAYCFLPRDTWKNLIICLCSGALCGIIPDIFGDRSVAPWSHSVLFTPFVVLGIACLTKLFYKKTSFKLIWGSSILSVLFGHLFLDYMGHDLPAFYPLSDKSYIMGAITLGDPWIWFPLIIGLGLSVFLRNKPKLPVVTSILFILVYLVFRIISKEIIEHKVQVQHPVPEKSYIIVEPDSHYEFPLDPRKWLEFRFRVISPHFSKGGDAGILGEKSDKLFWYDFYPVAFEINLSRGKYVPINSQDSKVVISVTKEWKEAGSNFIQGKYDGNLLTYKETTNGQWEEVIPQ
ncbi:inner membrane protein [Paenibacillus xylanexedens]|uniref:metal-dependent hydrolase n=1 Tax=Paenibacillus xylanexedens TaxID=528191 RepID=UPI0020A040CC|nr:metal-dependent hydrolase [Paenibacillus xylanexedens]MCP1424134.1 inner membrane protein [Paenibacillus xylanexedens]